MVGVLDAGQVLLESLQDFGALLLNVGITLEHLPDLLQRLAGDILARKLLEHAVSQAVLAGLAADVHLVDDPAGRQLLDRADFLLQVVLLGKGRHDGLQLLLGILVTLAVQEQLDQL